MSDLLQRITEAVSFIWGLFSTLFDFITAHPIILYAVLIPIVVSVISILIGVLRRFGIRSRGR